MILVLLLGILIYSNTFRCSFHFDDFPRIVDNTSIRDITNIRAWWNSYPTRPFGMFTFVLNWHFNQLNVKYYHIVNLVIHLMNALLVWWLTLLIFSTPVLKDQPIAKRKKAIAFFTALLFVSHPLATQSVTYIIQRFASLVSLFYFLSLILYTKARLLDKTGPKSYLLYSGALLSAFLAMLTKENAFTLPVMILVIEIFFFRRKKIVAALKSPGTILTLVFLAGFLILLFFVFSTKIFKPITPINGTTVIITPFNYLLTQFPVIVKYIQLLLVPVNLNVDYDFPVSMSIFELRTSLSRRSGQSSFQGSYFTGNTGSSLSESYGFSLHFRSNQASFRSVM